MSTNGQKKVSIQLESIDEHAHPDDDSASADNFVVNKPNTKSDKYKTKTTGPPPAIQASNKEAFDAEYAVKTVPIDYDSSDICCYCCGLSWRPRPRCLSATIVCILLVIILPLSLVNRSEFSTAVELVPTAAPTSEAEIAVDDRFLTETPSENPSEVTSEMPTGVLTMVPITAPVATPVLTLSPTNGATKSPFGDIPIVTDMPTSSTTALTPTSLSPTPLLTTKSPTPQPTNSPTEPSLTLALSGDVISDAAPPGSQFGYTLSLSHNGDMLSVGAPLYEKKGMARAYGLSTDQWQQLGPDLYGDKSDGRFGWATTLSANGLVMATSGGLSGGGTVPYVRVYNNVSPDGWSPRGGDLAGNFGFGNSVSLSADGGRIAVGAKNIVNVFEYDEESDKWDLIGVMKERYASVALSENGDVLAVGGPYSNDVYQEGGLVKVWEYEGGESWALRGGAAAMYGHDAMVKFGYSVAISNDGGVVAAGSLEGNYVKVSRFSDGSWMPYGEDIQGEEDDNKKFGFKVALSGDAERLVVGSPLYMNYNGRSVVYNFNNKEQTWDTVMDVVGTITNDQEGYAVAMSSDGSSIASSAMNANNGAGRVRVFNLQ